MHTCTLLHVCDNKNVRGSIDLVFHCRRRHLDKFGKIVAEKFQSGGMYAEKSYGEEIWRGEPQNFLARSRRRHISTAKKLPPGFWTDWCASIDLTLRQNLEVEEPPRKSLSR